MEIQPDLSICLLHQDEHTEALANLLDSLYTHAEPVSFEVILVAERPDSAALARLEHEFPDLTILESRPGESPTRARNHAFRLASGRFLACFAPHLLLRPTTLPLLVELLDENPDAGMAAPRIIDQEGRVLPTVRTFPSLATVLASHAELGPRLGLTSRLPHHLLSDRDHLISQEAEWLLDTCLLIRKEVVEEIGLFDEGFANLFSDADLCLRALRAGWHLHYLATAVAVQTSPAAYHTDPPAPSLLSDGARFLFKKWLRPMSPSA